MSSVFLQSSMKTLMNLFIKMISHGLTQWGQNLKKYQRTKHTG